MSPQHELTTEEQSWRWTVAAGLFVFFICGPIALLNQSAIDQRAAEAGATKTVASQLAERRIQTEVFRQVGTALAQRSPTPELSSSSRTPVLPR